jgi:3-hydroxyacyl-[acyl-carrier-protein] dehydratase
MISEKEIVRYEIRIVVPTDHASFPGHFPGNPILPGVLLLERIMTFAQSKSTQLPPNCTLLNVKFLAAVSPGDELELQLSGEKDLRYQFSIFIVPTDKTEELQLACSGQIRLAQLQSTSP